MDRRLENEYEEMRRLREQLRERDDELRKRDDELRELRRLKENLQRQISVRGGGDTSWSWLMATEPIPLSAKASSSSSSCFPSSSSLPSTVDALLPAQHSLPGPSSPSHIIPSTMTSSPMPYLRNGDSNQSSGDSNVDLDFRMLKL